MLITFKNILLYSKKKLIKEINRKVLFAEIFEFAKHPKLKTIKKFRLTLFSNTQHLKEASLKWHQQSPLVFGLSEMDPKGVRSVKSREEEAKFEDEGVLLPLQG